MRREERGMKQSSVYGVPTVARGRTLPSEEESAMRRRVGLLGMVLVLLLTGHMPVGAQTAKVVPKGKIVLAWHTMMASKWLDPQEHDGTATPDNFLNALHD